MASRVKATRYPGVYRVHRRGCGHGAACSCPGAYQATVYSVREGKRLRKHFDTLGAARTWRDDAGSAIRAGTLRTPTRTTVEQASAALIAGMTDGSIYDRSGRPYKPSTVRSYETAMRLWVLPALGHRRLSSIERRDVQKLVERMHGSGRSASSVANSLNPLQVICRRALHAGDLAIDPTVGLNLPAVRGRRDKIASPEHARALIDALPDGERAFWATALYAGLRRGELRSLRWRHVDFEARMIRVESSWDPEAGEIGTKTDAGRRTVPLADALRRELAAHKLRTGRGEDDLTFGRTGSLPFIPSTVRARALSAWKTADLEPLTTHEARHCAASYLIAAGLNAKELSVYIGHSDIRTTYNRYGHLMPGGEVAAADRLSAFLDAAARS
jgi:integrase